MKKMKKIAFDDYNQNIPTNQDVIGTVTTTWGHLALRNGWKILEVSHEEEDDTEPAPRVPKKRDER